MLNIIIRTSWRPLQFKACIESIREQDTPVNVIVGYDNNRALEYVDKKQFADVVDVSDYPRTGRYFYNGYLNQLLSSPALVDGHVLILDDDDKLNAGVLKQMEKFIKPGHSYIFPFIRPNGFQKPTPSQMFVQRISVGYIGMPCLVLSTKHIRDIFFGQTEDADYKAILELSTKVNLIWVNLPLVTASVRNFGNMEK